MRQPTEIKVDSTKILTTLMFLLTLFSVIPAFALFFDFDDNEKPQQWKEKGGKWKVENGMYVRGELNAIEGVTLIREADWTDVTMGPGIPLAVSPKGKLASTWARVKARY